MFWPCRSSIADRREYRGAGGRASRDLNGARADRAQTPRGPIRSPVAGNWPCPPEGAACTAPPTSESAGPTTESESRRRQPSARRLLRLRLSGVRQRRRAARSFGGEGVEPATWTAFACCHIGALPLAREQPHGLEAAERAVERAVAGQCLMVGMFGEGPCELVAVKGAVERRCGEANRLFERDESACLLCQ